LVEQSRNKPRGKQPVTRHPLFPAIVGLWGAVLFGLAALAVTPSAAPAVVLAVFGGAAGLIVARQIARPKPARSGSEAAAAAGNGPTSSGATAGEADDLWSELRTSRLALTARSEEPEAEIVPAPAPAPAATVFDRAPQILDLAAVEIAAVDDYPFEPDTAEEALAVEAAPEPIAERAAEPATEAQPTAAERITGAGLGELSHVELLERLALSLQRRGASLPAAPMPGQMPEPIPEPVPDLADLYEAAAATPETGAEPRPEPEAAIVFPGRAQRHASAAATAAPAPASPEATEETLRAALAALQRMSGAA